MSQDRPPYKVRVLTDESEVEGWLDFVAQCFAFKGVLREHFAAHFWCDPWRDAKLVVVAETCETDKPAELVSTLRIFQRQIYLFDGSVLRVGGIGEVCTREDWQRRGLCRELLSYAQDVMRTKGMACACLHTSSMGQVYQRCGFVSMPEFRVVVKIHLRRAKTLGAKIEGHWLQKNDGDLWVRPRRAALPLGTDLPLLELMAQHTAFHQGRFCGAMARSEAEYWSSYVSANTVDAAPFGCYWLQASQHPSEPSSCCVRAFACFKHDNGAAAQGRVRVRLADFSASLEEVASDGGRFALETMLLCAFGPAHVRSATNEALCEEEEGEWEGAEVLIRMPRPLAEVMGYWQASEACSTCGDDVSDATEEGVVEESEVHGGTMYSPLAGQDIGQLLEARSHVTWAVDGF